LLRSCGLIVEDLLEVIAPLGSATELARTIPMEWARRWPAEEVWIARRHD